MQYGRSQLWRAAAALAAVLMWSVARAQGGAPPFIISSEITFPNAGVRLTDLAVDANGNTYLAGTLASSNFPGVDSSVFANAGVNQRFVARFGPFGSTAQYIAIVGWPVGSWQGTPNNWLDDDEVAGLVVDASGNAYVVSHELTTNFPNIGTRYQHSIGPLYVYKISSTGAATRWSRPLDPAIRRVAAMARDASGSLYLTGGAIDGLQTTPGAPYSTPGVASGCVAPYVVKLDATGQSVAYATYLGYSGVQGQVCGGKVYTPAGVDAVSIHPSGFSIAVDASGNAYVTGQAEPGFAATPGAVDFGTKVPSIYPYDPRVVSPASHAFVAKINAAGTGIVFNARLGGSLRDRGTSVMVDSSGGVLVAGKTSSSRDFPRVGTALPSPFILWTQCLLYTPEVGFIARLTPDGSRLVFSYLLPMDGGQLDDCGGSTAEYTPARLAFDAAGNILVAGYTDLNTREVDASAGAIIPDPFVNASQQGGQVLQVLTADGQQLLYTSVLPRDNVRGIAVDRWQNIVIASRSGVERISAGHTPVDLTMTPSPACAGSTTTLKAVAPGANDSGSVDFSVVDSRESYPPEDNVAVNVEVFGLDDTVTPQAYERTCPVTLERGMYRQMWRYYPQVAHQFFGKAQAFGRNGSRRVGPSASEQKHASDCYSTPPAGSGGLYDLSYLTPLFTPATASRWQINF